MLTTIIATATIAASGILTPMHLPLGDLSEEEKPIIEIMREERAEQLQELKRKQNYAIALSLNPILHSYSQVPLNIANSQTIVLPVASSETSSHFGHRTKPCDACSSWHRGLDFTLGWGEPVYSMAEGEVIDVGYNPRGYGRYIYIEHKIRGERFLTAYAHLIKDGVLVEEGDSVSAGQEIATVGSTGISTGAHLHFEIRNAEDEYLDPEEFFQEYYIPIRK
jgi:murein DD-endopeptidase MepM/ murein hydrolase activator NlpD